ncbi:MAG: aspartate--tRNA ligase [Pseudomonadota bacterium]|nr:aspartate--tRNA ligase [Pseudomonadota bacterium]|tara:strand:- start:4641 stop:6407 length:1767 start_codon:yes stop_codon:yes gene_type:complete
MKKYLCTDICESLLNKEITVYGWVSTRRDHGGVIFLDLRDYSGVLQLVFHPDNKPIFEVAENIRSEYVLQVTGTVCKRPEGTINNDLKTGKIEIDVKSVVVLNKSKTPPIQINDEELNEEQRLQFRHLDIRSNHMQNNLRFRSKLIAIIRNFFYEREFVDVETPVLTKTTPEGARDYLVPSRIYANKFFALPQSPQLFKQTLMIGGLDKYFQIAKCFRDEDLRADRQPEFTQLDLEMSFVEEKDIMNLCEELFSKIFSELMDKTPPINFCQMQYPDSLRDYGCDKPDLRNPLILREIKEIVSDVEFKVFSAHANKKDSRIVALNVPNGCSLSNKQIEDYTNLVMKYGAKGLAYIKCKDVSNIDQGLESPIKKFLKKDVLLKIIEITSAKNNDLIFFSADTNVIVNESMSSLIKTLGSDLKLLKDTWEFVWITGYPLFEQETKTNNLTSVHHPFTSPVNINDIDKKDLLSIESRAYDLILNGNEIGGGSIRIHSKDLQIKVFSALGIEKDEMNKKFGFFLNALDYGCPPHGGIAFGIDRIIMILLKLNSIRDTIAFPKTQSTSCMLTEAPSDVDDKQLKELSLKTIKNN